MNAPSAALRVRESGQPGSPAIVFLHGTGASGGMWEEHLQRLGGYHCLAPDLPGHGRSNHLPWRSRIDTAEQVAGLIRSRIPSRRAHLVGLSLGGSLAHTLLAGRQDLLDRVVIDGCGALPAWWIGPMKLAVAAVSPVIHRGPVIGLFARMVGVAPSGRDRFTADLQRRVPARLPARLRRRQWRPHLQPGGRRPLPDPAGGGRAGGQGRPVPPTRHWPP